MQTDQSASRAGVGFVNAPAVNEEAEEPPSSGCRHPKWKNVSNEQWTDWRWQMQHAVRTTEQVAELLPLNAADRQALVVLESRFKTSIPPYYFSLINPNDEHDPIRIQSVPSALEMTSESGLELEDPLEEDKDSPVPGVTHRYPDRALLVTTPVCSMYCRFCTRKRVTMDREAWDGPTRDEINMVEYVRAHSEIHDVILSGGDALMLAPSKLDWFLTQLAAIEHVDVIRVGTRVPVTLPQKLFDLDLVRLLAKTGKVWIQTHFNHPIEITPEAAKACRNLINHGMPINNHSVLLKGVNDSVATMRSLIRGLLRIKVRPYYLFHCDPVTGAGHMRCSIWKGMEIIEGLRGHMSGLGIPTYVVDGLHGTGKIPIMPNYIVSASENSVILRNYEGVLFRYTPEDKANSVQEGIASVGVSNLLSGNGRVLTPESTPRIERRRAREVMASDAAPPNMLPIIQIDTTSCNSEPVRPSIAAKPPLKKGRPASQATASRRKNAAPAANGNGNRPHAARPSRVRSSPTRSNRKGHK